MKFSEIPFDEIVKVGNHAYLDTKMFNVNWLLGRFCNYHCSYCWPYAHTKKRDYRSFHVIKQTIDKIVYEARNRGYDSFSFSFSGGEPTIHPKFLDIIRYISMHDAKVNITSNCSRSKEWLKKLINVSKKLRNMSITASFHPEFEKPENFLEKIKLLKSNGIITQINVVLLENDFDTMWNYAKFFYDNGISVQAKMQVQYIDGCTIEGKYTKEQLEKIKNGFPRLSKSKYTFFMYDYNNELYKVDNVERVVGLGFNRFKGWVCEAGYRSIIITEPTGLIKRHYMCLDQPLGHIETGFKLYDKPKKCITEICGSCADCKIPKFKEVI